MNAGGADGEEAAVGVLVVDAVLELAPPEVQDAEDRLEIRLRRREARRPVGVGGHRAPGGLHLGDGLVHAALVGPELAEVVVIPGDLGEALVGGGSGQEGGQVLLEGRDGRGQGFLPGVADAAQAARVGGDAKAGQLRPPRHLGHGPVVTHAGRAPVPGRRVRGGFALAEAGTARRHDQRDDEAEAQERHAAPGGHRRGRGTKVKQTGAPTSTL